MATRGKAWSKARAACPRPEGLLLLTQLHANRQGDALAYAKSIRACPGASDLEVWLWIPGVSGELGVSPG
ncbi:MAG: hypothetical protein EXQ70_10015 [Solirubrobacterales bacterium]|nr:hypothetical protein [Solirubrobacterales bacterium]